MTILSLKEPIILRSKDTGEEVTRIAEVTFRAPRAGDLVAAMDAGKAGNGSMMAALCARCTGLTVRQVEDLSISDFMALTEIAADFLPAGPLTGRTLSLPSSAPSVSLPAGSAGQPPNSAS